MFGRPWNLGPIRISAEIRWAVRHGYIAGKNGRKSWLSGLDVVRELRYSFEAEDGRCQGQGPPPKVRRNQKGQ